MIGSEKLFLPVLISSLIFLFTTQNVNAQVKYKDVIEKIHYTDGMSYDTDTGKPAVVSKEIGATNPAIKVYIYGDLSEVYTKKFFTEIFSYLKNKYPDAKFIFRNAVFMESNEGMQVAGMVNCLAEQNQFWNNTENLINLADLKNPSFSNIDKDKFNNCINNQNTKLGVDIETNSKKNYGFNSVPTIIIQNTFKPQDYVVKVTGAQSVDIFDRAFLEAKEGDLTKIDLEELKAEVANIKQDVAQNKVEVQEVKEQVSGLKGLIETILKQIEALFELIKK